MVIGSPNPQYNLLQVNIAVNFRNIVEVDEKKSDNSRPFPLVGLGG